MLQGPTFRLRNVVADTANDTFWPSIAASEKACKAEFKAQTDMLPLLLRVRRGHLLSLRRPLYALRRRLLRGVGRRQRVPALPRGLLCGVGHRVPVLPPRHLRAHARLQRLPAVPAAHVRGPPRRGRAVPVLRLRHGLRRRGHPLRVLQARPVRQ